MEFELVLYEDSNGFKPVKEFLRRLRTENISLHKLVIDGIGKLQNRTNHGEPLTKYIGDDLYELRVGRKDTARVLWLFVAGAKIVLLSGFVKKTNEIPKNERTKALSRKADYLRRFCRR